MTRAKAAGNGKGRHDSQERDGRDGRGRTGAPNGALRGATPGAAGKFWEEESKRQGADA